jgi:IclR family pca regulon transcriptional regulator
MTRLREVDAKKRAENNYGADFSEALARGLSIIMAFNAQRRQMTLSEVARVADLPRATARRALYTLSILGFVETEGRQFRLTPRIMNLATTYLLSNPVSSIVQPACERISTKLDASCSVGVLDGGEVVMVARASAAGPVTVGLGVGYRLRAYCSSLGRVLLSALPEDKLNDYLAKATLEAATPYTVVDKTQLKRMIREMKSTGFALVDRESEPGIRSIAVPLKRYDGTTIAALNIAVQVEKVTLEVMVADYLPLLRAEADELKKQLI